MQIERKGVYVCVFHDFELLRYVQFSSSLCVNVSDRRTAFISRWDEYSRLLLLHNGHDYGHSASLTPLSFLRTTKMVAFSRKTVWSNSMAK